MPQAVDVNMTPGAEYTFSFKATNWFSNPGVSNILQLIADNAPSFIGQPNAAYSGSTFNLSFAYQGDGSDVIQDVANELIAAMSTAGDSWAFISADFGSAARADVNYSTGTGVLDRIQNALPTWLGGTPVTQDQSDARIAASQQSIKSAAGSSDPTVQAAANAQVAGAAADIQSITKTYTALTQSASNKWLAVLIGGFVIIFAGALLVQFGGYTGARKMFYGK